MRAYSIQIQVHYVSIPQDQSHSSPSGMFPQVPQLTLAHLPQRVSERTVSRPQFWHHTAWVQIPECIPSTANSYHLASTFQALGRHHSEGSISTISSTTNRNPGHPYHHSMLAGKETEADKGSLAQSQPFPPSSVVFPQWLPYIQLL